LEERRVPVVICPAAAGVFLAQSLNPRGGQRLLLALPIFLFLAPTGFSFQPFSLSAFASMPSAKGHTQQKPLV